MQQEERLDSLWSQLIFDSNRPHGEILIFAEVYLIGSQSTRCALEHLVTGIGDGSSLSHIACGMSGVGVDEGC